MEPAPTLWAVDMDGEGQPCRIHRIAADDGTTRTTVCGQRLTAGRHPRGWWSSEPGEPPPMAEHAVHCN